MKSCDSIASLQYSKDIFKANGFLPLCNIYGSTIGTRSLQKRLPLIQMCVHKSVQDKRPLYFSCILNQIVQYIEIWNEFKFERSVQMFREVTTLNAVNI